MNNSKRPILKIPLSLPEKALQLICLLNALSMPVYLFVKWHDMPARIPKHFDFSGNVDSWGGRGSLIFLPVVVLLLYGLLTILERFPHVFNYTCEITEDNARFQYQNARLMMLSLKTLLVLLFTYIEWRMTEVALGGAKSLGIWFLPVILVLIACVLIFFIMRMQKNK
jgi:uncharacterized membrane protein